MSKRPPPDRITVAWLHGAASRHTSWTRPVGEAREAAIAELREIATERVGRTERLRTDLLAQVAGICRGAALQGGLSAPHLAIMADLCVDAGADLAMVETWVPIGLERAGRTRGAPGFARGCGPDG